MPRLQSASVSVYEFFPVAPASGDNEELAIAGAVGRAACLQFKVSEECPGAAIIGHLDDSGAGNTMTVQVSADGISWSAVTDTANAAFHSPPLNGAAQQAVGSVNLTSVGVAPSGRLDFGFTLRAGLDKYVRFTGATSRGTIQLRGGERALVIQKI